MTVVRRPSRLSSAVAFLWVLPLTFFAYFTVLKPWPVARQALADHGPGPRIVVAMSLQGSVEGPSRRSQTYLIVPASLRSLAAYEVIQDRGRVRVESRPYGLLAFGGFYLIWVVASIVYLSRRQRRS